MVVNKMSQRGLAAYCGITSGGITKYLRGEVSPENVSLSVQLKIAEALGVTVDSLWRYYETGEYQSGISAQDVESWLRSESGQEDLPVLMSALQEAGSRWLQQSGRGGLVAGEEKEDSDDPPYTWPREEIATAEVPERILQRLGLTEEVLDALERGEFDEEVVEAFSVACNYEVEAVREAFKGRKPIGE